MVYFAVSIFLSAFLLFQVEPMIAKIILPWFGGTPAVWSTVMLFFQLILTGGYAYANWLASKAARREIVHLFLLGVSLVLMLVLSLTWKSPITPGSTWKPEGSFSPIWEIFKLLTISVGLPFFLLASNSPLVQAWFNRIHPGRPAYQLYALSNAGSLIALVSYPVLIEPTLALFWQGRVWSLAYVVYAGLAAFGAIRVLRMKPVLNGRTGGSYAVEGHQQATAGVSERVLEPRMAGAGLAPRPTISALWIALSGTASVLLLATTSHITQEVAVIPFLWVLPLTIYLLTFVLAFSGERWYSRQFYLVVLFLATLLYGWAMVAGSQMIIPLQLGIYSLVLFAACMVCHGELYRLRPHPDHLTAFYLMVSLGGALGGIVVNFVAPYIFKGFWELPIGTVLCWILFLAVVILSKSAPRPRLLFIVNSVLLLAAVIISAALAVQYVQADLTGSVGSWRNFYGVVRIREFGSSGEGLHSYALVHGITVHGLQFTDSEESGIPTTYYGQTGGGGLAILNHPRRGQGMRVGVLGLGVGTLSVYGQPGDIYRFYEINPVVIQLAEGEGGYFTYLEDTRAEVEIVAGDARLSLEHELADGNPQNYDILVLDVFSSDSIPVHLLDKESFEIYLKHLAGDGVLAVHITNRYLDLAPVVQTLADYFHLSYTLIEDPGDGSTSYRSIWMLLARDPALLQNPAIQSRATPMLGYATPIRLWTDDYSNLFQILK